MKEGSVAYNQINSDRRFQLHDYTFIIAEPLNSNSYISSNYINQ